MEKDPVLIFCVILRSIVNVPSKVEPRNPQAELRDGNTDDEPYQYRKITFRCWLMGGAK